MRRFLLVLLVLAIIGAGVVEWANAVWPQPGPPALSGNQTVVLIQPHTRLHDIARQLEDAHILNYALVFEFDLRVRGLADKVRAGEYAIPGSSSMADIAAILISGKSIEHKLTAAEGLTSEMIWKLVQADPVLTGDAGPAPDEGTLLPETYLFTRGTTRAQLLDEMRKAQEKFVEAQWDKRAAGLPFQTREQALTLASIVEKETALPDERRHIASVFVNRLKAGMKLQSDPTIIYGLTKGYPLGRGIRESEITGPTPYNTYVIAGLPPGPICNPGKDSIAAILNPAEGNDLYFVATGKGGHVFSATMAEHERNVIAWRAAERRKEGIADPAPVQAKPIPPAKAAPSHRRRHV
jgi:UPF0755 protein